MQPTLLREKYADDEVQRYEMKMKYRGTGESRASETVHAVVYRRVVGRTADKYANLYLRRRDLTRRMTEITEKGHRIIETTPMDIQPVLSPIENRVSDKSGKLYFYPCDDRRRFAFSEDRPFHQLNYVSVAFFFPILPKDLVTVGDTWSGGKLRVMIGWKFYFNNDFPLQSTHTLREFRSIGGHTVAVIDYDYSGRFDSAEHPDRFTERWRGAGRVIHEAQGSGTAYYDVDLGAVIWKKDEGTVTVRREFYMPTTRSSRGRKTTTTETDVVVTKTEVSITQRLMGKDERLPGTGPGR